MHVTNCCFLLSKAGFCFDILFLFFFFCGFPLLFLSNTRLVFSMKLSRHYSLASILYLVKLVFFMSNMGEGRGVHIFLVKLCLRVWCFADVLNHSQFVIGQRNTCPQMFVFIVLQHCCLLVELEIFDMKHLLFCTAWINEEDVLLPFFFFCTLFAVTVLLFCLFICIVLFTIFGDNHFFYIFVICIFIFFSPSVQVDEKLLYFVYKTWVNRPL